MKDVRSRRGCPVGTFCGQGRGFFRWGRSHFLAQKLWIFRNLSCVRRGKGVNFRDFLRTSFMDGPLLKTVFVLAIIGGMDR